MELQEAVPPTL
ncbi:hypothetical protein QR98_0010280 [Sarcoptes scabiei]|uniref:Uncharacterized protein n=1 Tax=Sarcoptes scabiei TaxID=52283 RepID=A0A131ZUX6_SARSC|nr:hypothetical protein QR98_0010280 [Sarcoptes scabiei]